MNSGKGYTQGPFVWKNEDPQMLGKWAGRCGESVDTDTITSNDYRHNDTDGTDGGTCSRKHVDTESGN